MKSSVFAFTFLAAALALLNSKPAHACTDNYGREIQCPDEDQIFENGGNLGVGVGVEGETNSVVDGSAATNATFSIRYMQHGSSDQPMAAINLNIDYNVLGINTDHKGMTSISIRVDGGVFGDLRVSSQSCGLYAGGSVMLTQPWQPTNPAARAARSALGARPAFTATSTTASSSPSRRRLLSATRGSSRAI